MGNQFHKQVNARVRTWQQEPHYYKVSGSKILLQDGALAYWKEAAFLSGGAVHPDFLGTSQTFVNHTMFPVFLKEGYSTVRNGCAQRIVCPPRKAIHRYSPGNAYDFSEYAILSIEDISEPAYHFRGE